MTSNIEKHLQELDQCLIHSEYQRALKIIEEDLQRADLSKESQLSLLVFKGMVFFFLGRMQESLELSKMLLQESEKLDNDSLKLGVLVLYGVNLWTKGRFEEAIALTDKGLLLAQTAKDLPEKELNKRKAQFLIWKAESIFRLGDSEKGLKLAEEAVSVALQSEYPSAISTAFSRLALIHGSLGNEKKYEEFREKSLEAAKSAGNKFLIALGYMQLAQSKSHNRQYQEAIELYEEAFAISKEIGSTLLLSNYIDLASIYVAMFQLDKALECLKESIKYEAYDPYIEYFTKGRIFFWKYELKKAQEYLIKSKKKCEEIKEKRILPMVLYYLVLVFLELKDYEQAHEHLTYLEQIYKETGFIRIKYFYQFAKIRLFIDSGTIGDLAQATDLLNTLFTESDLPSDWRLDVLYSLLEIRIKELAMSANKVNLQEAQKQAIRLEVEVEERQFRWALANVYRLQSQLALVELDVVKALELLTKAQVIAEEINVELLKRKVKEDQKKIEQQLNMYQNLQKQQAPISESIKLVSLENLVKNVKQETVLEERDKETGQIIEYRKLFALKI